MKRISTSNRAVNKFGTGKDGFQGGSPATGVKSTYLDETWCDHIQEEIAVAVEGAGITIDETKYNQLLTAIKSIAWGTGQTTSPLNRGSFPTASGQDFNSVTVAGDYSLHVGNYTGILNSPILSYGTMTVVNAGTFHSQLVLEHGTGLAFWRVQYVDTPWGAWNRITSYNDLVGVIESIRNLIDNVYSKSASDARYNPMLGYAPVQNGTGDGQTANNLVKIGWTQRGRLNVQVDSSNLGDIALITDFLPFAPLASPIFTDSKITLKKPAGSMLVGNLAIDTAGGVFRVYDQSTSKGVMVDITACGIQSTLATVDGTSAQINTALASYVKNTDNTGSFTSASGWVKRANSSSPSGFEIEQRKTGTAQSTEGNQTIIYPVTFPNGSFPPSVTTIGNWASDDSMYQLVSYTNNSCVVSLNRLNANTGNVTPVVSVTGW